MNEPYPTNVTDEPASPGRNRPVPRIPDFHPPTKDPSPRPVDGDDPVHKTVIRAGTGPIVPLHATCLVRYAGRVLSTGEVFIDTTDPSSRHQTDGDLVQVVAGRDAVRQNRGLYQLVGTMRKGEVCEAFVHYSAGYGDAGNFSFPSVPPKADLSYVVELVDFEPPPQNGTQSDGYDGYLTYEERLEAAKRRRMQGNERFSRDDSLDEALSIYKSALAFLDDDFMMQLYDFHYDKAIEEKKTVMLNMTACYLRLERPREAADLASMVLAVDAKNPKALFRRGVARRRLGQTAGALEDLERARLQNAEDSGILREIALVKGELRREETAQGRLYKSMMTKSYGSGTDHGGLETVATAPTTTKTRDPPSTHPKRFFAAIATFFWQICRALVSLFRTRTGRDRRD